MKIYTNLNEAREKLFHRRSWEDIQLSPAAVKGIEETFGERLTAWQAVERIVRRVRKDGDAALRDFTLKFDRVEVEDPEVDRRDMYRGYRRLSDELKESLELSAQRIRAFHLWQMEHTHKSFLMRGLGQKVTPLERVGVYVPGGTAVYPSTVLMTAIPARVAGVKDVVVATPPRQNGKIADAVLAAAYLSGVARIFKVGGAQAIAAMAFGTATIPKVDKICGPGNIFVVLAKKIVFGEVGIDGLAGPTETVILADETADPAICAADLLAQAEHDVMASAIMITDSSRLAEKVQGEVGRQLARLERSRIAVASLDRGGGIVKVKDLRDGVDIINTYAPEHVSLMVKYPDLWARKVRNAGCLFLGERSAEAFGDYVAGPSHVLPTGGSARFSSALGVGEFLKVTGVVRLNARDILKVGPAAAKIAEAEGLTAHSRAAEARLKSHP
ncbi:MAG: histidinol dehydrogenase [Chloroflexi bacterium]|nr:histidinol dehydrogenase [Chloroflexota bacterium]